jgi:MoaA/NifB/PqqE/SkfB family radical SAM enzyme
MSEPVFRKVLADAMNLSPRPRLYFGGIGEPLLHPNCVDWIGEASERFETVLQTNAEFLTPEFAEALLKTGLKRVAGGRVRQDPGLQGLPQVADGQGR